MGKKDKRIDAYIAKQADFAKPILNHLRFLVHEACPDVEETIKWGMPSFDYKGPYFSMAAFKQHCACGFWKAAIMKDAARLLANQENAMGHGGRISSLKDLPTDKTLLRWLKEAAKLNDDKIKLPALTKSGEKKPEIQTPDYFIKELKKNKAAFNIWEAFAPSHRREYNMWIQDAKTDDTRNRRMSQAIEWIAEGKGRNWKYEKK